MSDLFQQLGGVLQQYAQGQKNPDRVSQDAEQAMHSAPHESVVGALAGAMRSHETPPFGQLLSHLWGNADNQQRSGILNTLLSSVGGSGGSITGFLEQAGLGHLTSLLGSGQVAPQQASQVRAEDVQKLANHAEQRDGSVVERASDFLSAHPGLVKTLGAGALAVFMGHLARKL